jgi:hypothetical protein
VLLAHYPIPNLAGAKPMSANPTPFEQKQKERAEIVNQIKTTLTKLKTPDQVFEIRLFLKDGKTIAGMFDHNHINECVDGIFQYYQTAKAIYFVLNDFPTDLLSWSANKFRVVKSGDHTVADRHISHRTHILIDIDPKRLSKEGIELSDISSTDEEKEKAKQTLNQVLEYLRSLGWPEPMIGSSGNGYHLIFAIDLPNTPESTDLVKNLLTVLAQKFDDSFAQVDKKVFNAARITKLFGTIARKGDPIESRPHRMAKILHLPEQFLVVNKEQLAEVASLVKEEAKPTPPKTEYTYSEAKREASNKGFTDLSTRIRNYMDKLPMAISGQDGSGATFRAACILLKGFGLSINEALSYLEEWNQTHCSPTWNTKDLLHKLNDADKAPSDKPVGYLLNDSSFEQSSQTNPSRTKTKAEEKQNQPIIEPKSLKSLWNKVFPDLDYLIQGILPAGGVNLVCGSPKTGKTNFCTNLGLSLAYGGVFLGQKVEKTNVLLLNLEDGERRLKQRVATIIAENEEPPDNFDYISGVTGLNAVTTINHWLEKQIGRSLVIIDTLAKFRGIMKNNQNLYDFDYQSPQLLRELAEKYQVTFLIIHHTRKAESEDVLNTISGSLGLSGACDNIFVLKRARSSANAEFHIVGRDMEDQQLALRYSYPYWSLLGEAEEYSQSEIRRTIISI